MFLFPVSGRLAAIAEAVAMQDNQLTGKRILFTLSTAIVVGLLGKDSSSTSSSSLCGFSTSFPSPPLYSPLPTLHTLSSPLHTLLFTPHTKNLTIDCHSVFSSWFGSLVGRRTICWFLHLRCWSSRHHLSLLQCALCYHSSKHAHCCRCWGKSIDSSSCSFVLLLSVFVLTSLHHNRSLSCGERHIGCSSSSSFEMVLTHY
jgi:hypothetical protein